MKTPRMQVLTIRIGALDLRTVGASARRAKQSRSAYIVAAVNAACERDKAARVGLEMRGLKND